MPSKLPGRFPRFLGVGALGFLVDGGVFAIAIERLMLGPVTARVLSFLAAAAFTWALNRRFTFADRASSRPAAELGRYTLSSLAAGAVNLTAYTAIVLTLGSARPIPYLALAAGVGAGLMINFVLYDRVVFRKNAER
ncbi:Putative flippase GtrA (transmembrane translocase of bactoprenol-linked glucose) [Bosea sp. OK403]|uniref:GtrA family protein n=1 Tax=Bosea sp. OK403 TaxID=1855286 RepID=UPI0008E173F9|nr:GtrA family protein [Bosea sp. OK403]SFH95229.1 Putative flippase GtrA (transmembrane translocase of bactoprenol-linked glucose) [Bosea sp. OK403]